MPDPAPPLPPPPEPAPAPAGLRGRLPDDWAYVLPMLAFLAVTHFVPQSSPHYALGYTAKAVLVAGLLIWLRPAYTRVRWNHWWLGLLVGVVGIVQWVGMQLWLERHVPFFARSPDAHPFDPFAGVAPAWLAVAFVAVRVAGATLVVPVMEELFWRDYLWRRIVAPNDFKLAEVGEWDWKALLIVSGAFALVHGNWWLTSIAWALMVGGLLAYTKSLGACIVAHATTNALLAAYVLYTHDWAFW